jgi:hypothetical protein
MLGIGLYVETPISTGAVMIPPTSPCFQRGAPPSTVLKWCENGELSALDLEKIVERLQQHDPVAQSLDLSHFNALQLNGQG